MKATSTGVLRNLAKLMLNSLYGIMGIAPIPQETKIMTDNELANNNSNVLGISQLNDNLWIVDLSISEYRSQVGLRNIAAAAAITAYSRIHINKYKMQPGNPCFYSDTDSVVLQHPQPENEMGKEIGKIKLEHVVDEGLFQGPKVYGLRIKDDYIIKVKGLTKGAKLVEDGELTLLHTNIYTGIYNGFNLNETIQRCISYSMPSLVKGSNKRIKQHEL